MHNIDISNSRQLAAALGVPVFARTGSGANWHDWETWMSLSPHEIESQELAIHTLADQKPETCSDDGEWGEVVQRTVAETITLRPTNDADMDFLLRLYASTRIKEKELVGWDDEQWDGFIKRLFDLQHAQYQQNYRNPRFELVVLDGMSIGRLYLNRGEQEFRVIDISILPEYRGKGIGGRLLETLNREADAARLPVTLYVEKFNPALHLYQRLGFTIEADCGVQWFMVRHS